MSDPSQAENEFGEPVEEWTLSLRRPNQELLAEKKMFEVTLACMGDGVIITDSQAKITYLNPIAEVISGWSNAEAAGLPLPQVLKLVSETTREAIEDPVTDCLRSGEVRRLGDNALLIRRNGQELFIDDTASPIFNEARDTLGPCWSFGMSPISGCSFSN